MSTNERQQVVCLFHQRVPRGTFPGCGCYTPPDQKSLFSEGAELLIFDEASDVSEEMYILPGGFKI